MSGAPSREARHALLVAELSLVALSIGAVVGMSRLFVEGSFIVPVLSFALLAHGVAALCRRQGFSSWRTLAVAGIALALAMSWAFLPHTTTYGLPGSGTLAELGRQLSASWTTFNETRAPAPVETGFVLASVIGVWIIALVADSAAFQLGAKLEAVIPAFTLFVFGASLGAPPHQISTTALFFAAVLAYWLAQRSLSQTSSSTWLASNAGSHSRDLVHSGVALGVVAVLASVVIGPLLPGAEAKGVIPWRPRDRQGDSGRITISPLVDIRTRIVDQAGIEVFAVRSDTRSYWRLTSLETFDGRIWSSEGTYQEASGVLPPGAPSGSATNAIVEAEFEINGLKSIWLPAAYRPLRVEGTEARYEAESGSLITDEQDETFTGQVYTVASELSVFTEDELSAVEDNGAAEIDPVYLELPDDFPRTVAGAAFGIVDQGETPYQQARLLQDWFRGGTFIYDLNVGAGHGGDDLERFLFDTKRGYCEQFAGAFAAMARAIGIPARVAVGFTPGELAADGRYSVRGYNGHAWPEVYISGYGWVAFEPTPGRGIPGGESYTGVPEQQAVPGDPTTATTLSSAASIPGPGGVDPLADEIPDLSGLAGAADPNAVDPAAQERPSSWPRRLLTAIVVIVAAPLAWIGLLAVVTRWRRLRRRQRVAASPTQRVQLAWTEVLEELTKAGLPARPWETPVETAARAGESTDASRYELRALAGATTAAGFAPEGAITEAVAERAVQAADTLVQVVHDGLDTKERLRAAVDPRPLLPALRSRLDIRVEEPAGSRR